MAHTACLVCLVGTVNGCHKNAFGRGSARSMHKTKLEQSTFLKLSMIQVQIDILKINKI
jgi:hypothetical protein